MLHPNAYKDKQIVVLGLAKSGVAVAKLLHEAGAKVIVNDKKARSLCPEAEVLEVRGIAVVCGEHPTGLIHSEVELIVKNPGIPYSAEPLQKALELGIEIVTEVEVAYHICKAPIIGITGSNGKTTTTTWVGLILEAAELSPIVAGNIGRALCEAAEEATSEHIMVVELSSFQLKGTSQFKPHIACLLNLYETHLDYHGSFEDYMASKAKLFANQTADDIAILNWDDAHCRKLIPSIKAKLLSFSMREELAAGVFLKVLEDKAEWIVYRNGSGFNQAILATANLGIPARHNIQNALAVTAIALSCGVSIDIIAKVLQDFRGVEHRLEFVSVRAGITYINGSKATNPAATIKDLEAFERPIVLIAGGLDRGTEYNELAPYFREKLRALVTLGETKDKLKQVAAQAGIQLIRSVDNGNSSAEILEEAVILASELAEDGDVVLLSPACASWDMFVSYEERGRIFKQAVHNLKQGEAKPI
ncbi:UDP-N-acetylmuramoyl-L-alanine--D-glutamate ligase [Paenibacillus psychroresistens]|uniref:UDP-N-acetylmuramoylalanine--D-glutamate ligase n=1 Tax=Paenibacillus psychroresistens TaxID=1778678 RepID=A0A6B8RK30_9BACL|nr:UDP-N-acetylmuramoyl-L-alanine--D-glutamate ligase [Paenibacillus psychroresistens]QGQ95776.1 UDP-N-acetylmuramoyl-L-alanine--D-glutamate ligase [Paenibacillus psychroresistens]